MKKGSHAATHPGILLRKMLHEMEISQAELARAIRVSPMRISYVVNGLRPVTAELALLIGKWLGQSPREWVDLQTAHDLEVEEKALRAKLRSIKALRRR